MRSKNYSYWINNKTKNCKLIKNLLSSVLFYACLKTNKISLKVLNLFVMLKQEFYSLEN